MAQAIKGNVLNLAPSKRARATGNVVTGLIQKAVEGTPLSQAERVYLSAEVQGGGMADWQLGALWAALRMAHDPEVAGLFMLMDRQIQRRQGML